MPLLTLTGREENYVRISLLLKGICPRGVRLVFDDRFPPSTLRSTLMMNYEKLHELLDKRIVNSNQWKRLFTKDLTCIADSQNFDISLMVCLIRNLTSMKHPKHGFDRLPPEKETSQASDLARIKFYKNALVNQDNNTIDNETFNEAWRTLSIVSCIDTIIGSPTTRRRNNVSRMLDLRTKILDQSNHELMKEIMQSHDETEELKQSVQCLKLSYNSLKSDHTLMSEELNKIKESIPWNKDGCSGTLDDTVLEGNKNPDPLKALCLSNVQAIHTLHLTVQQKHASSLNVFGSGCTIGNVIMGDQNIINYAKEEAAQSDITQISK
ncbi:unnamed protein product [Mytilus coruscus]|uniref:DZIP3-like HEPN domain-containing protein n=1 Tax=Mytilus coruscus TaxID=42192 RepID=A0A6J8D9L8_MYTCO|nr:unnamed protein product [Mytilus coruscus]